jgi:superfamily II DNA or RNA helicase
MIGDRMFTSGLNKLAALKPGVKLNPIQVGAVKRVEDGDGSHVFAHDVGLGKTLTSIAAFEKLKEMGRATKALVIVPATLKDNFVTHGVRKFTNSSVHRVDDGKEKLDPKKTYNVISYELFKKDPARYVAESGADTIIMDEMHRVRDEGTQNYKKSLEARGMVKNFIGLTGSVINNSPKEIVPMLDVVTNRTHPFGSKDSFLNKLFTEQEKKTGVLGLYGNTITTWEPRKPPEYIGKTLKKFIDYKTVQDIDSKDLPKLKVSEIKVPMSEAQADVYRWALREAGPIAERIVSSNLPVDQKEASHVFAKILKARQACNAIHLFKKDMTLSESAVKTPKIKKILDDVEEHLKSGDDHKVVVFSNFVHGGTDVISQGLKDRGIEHGLFLGSGQEGSTTKKRAAAVEAFNANKTNVIVLSGAGGEGISFPNATLHVSVDGHYNPEKINQAEGRSRRFGGQQHREPEQRSVEVRRYVSTIPTTRKAFSVVGALAAGKPLDALDIVTGKEKSADSADQWVYAVASKKQKMNDHLKNIIKTASLKKDEELERYLEGTTTIKLPTKYSKVLHQYYAKIKDRPQTVATLQARLQDDLDSLLSKHEKMQNTSALRNYTTMFIPSFLTSYLLGAGQLQMRLGKLDRVAHDTRIDSHDFLKTSAQSDSYSSKKRDTYSKSIAAIGLTPLALTLADLALKHRSAGYRNLRKTLPGKVGFVAANIAIPYGLGYYLFPKKAPVNAKSINTANLLAHADDKTYDTLLSGGGIKIKRKSLYDTGAAENVLRRWSDR